MSRFSGPGHNLAWYWAVAGKLLEIGYSSIPNERGKGYCSEAIN